MATSEPGIKTTVVGSYPVPDWLGTTPSERTIADAIQVVIHTQEMAGIDVVADGECYRYDLSHPETNGMIEYFTRPLANVRSEITFDEYVKFEVEADVMNFRSTPAGVIEGPIGSGVMNLAAACRRSQAMTDKPFKFALTGPHMLAKTLVDHQYGDLPTLCDAIADVLAEQVARLDADIVQIDEANLPGHPDEWEWAASCINKVLDAVKNKPAVHLCFGNYGGQQPQQGTWGKLMDYLNALHVDHIVMENTHRPVDELEVFRDLRPEIGMGLGVLDVKATMAESPDQIARAIERADKIMGVGRVKYIHPDCGLWNLKRYIADRKLNALKAGRDLYEGRV
jgi:5-methyltetrahydropteroyltriglutamate--homocysteine methyltransferase